MKGIAGISLVMISRHVEVRIACTQQLKLRATSGSRRQVSAAHTNVQSQPPKADPAVLCLGEGADGVKLYFGEGIFCWRLCRVVGLSAIQVRVWQIVQCHFAKTDEFQDVENTRQTIASWSLHSFLEQGVIEPSKDPGLKFRRDVLLVIKSAGSLNIDMEPKSLTLTISDHQNMAVFTSAVISMDAFAPFKIPTCQS